MELLPYLAAYTYTVNIKKEEHPMKQRFALLHITILITLLLLLGLFSPTSIAKSELNQTTPTLAKNTLLGKQLARYCHWQKRCTGPRRCVRWVSRTRGSTCYLCGMYMRGQRIGNLVTCSHQHRMMAQRRGWRCVPRTTPRSVSTRTRHCVTWARQYCSWACR